MVTEFIVHQIDFNLKTRSVVDQREGDRPQREVRTNVTAVIIVRMAWYKVILECS